MKLIKRTLILCIILISIISSFPVFAENNVSEIAIEVVIRDDGSAYITQNWRGTFYEGTENYIPISTGDIGISNLRVFDGEGEYDYVDNWNINADFNAKKHKCGINQTDTGVELCFGISNYGENRYAIEYVVTDFIKSYNDFDGTNFMFVNPNMSTFPTDVTVDIVIQNGTELSEANAGIWSFGYEGMIEFQNGHVFAYTTNPLEGDSSVIVMLRLNKGIITPNTAFDMSFDEVKDRAFEGSDYGDYGDYGEEGGLFEEIIGYIILAVFFFIFLCAVAAFIYFLIKRGEVKKFYKEVNYFRDVPNNGNIEMSHFLAQKFRVSKNSSLIIGALMLSMINSHSLEPQTDESVGFFGKVKKSVNLKLIKEPERFMEKRLYEVLKCASGDDGILQEKELENYAYDHPKSINDIIDSSYEIGKTAFTSGGGFMKSFGGIKSLSESGKKELSEVMGLKKYLDEFSLINEREITETAIWKDYMVYAVLFGIADKVISQLKNIYPDRIEEFENYGRNVIIANSYCYSMHSSATRAMQAARTSGSGGFSSLGGGGGFSGGGSGGGSR